MKYYIAYGSNMSVEQMARRCPNAKLVGKAMLQDWKLKFKIHATIEQCEGSYVHALVWKIDKEDEKSLDEYEGWPAYYIKQDVEVTMTELDGTKPQKVTAMAYIMTEGHQESIPTPVYYDVMAEAYKRFGFDEAILQEALNEAMNAAAARNAAKTTARMKIKTRKGE